RGPIVDRRHRGPDPRAPHWVIGKLALTRPVRHVHPRGPGQSGLRRVQAAARARAAPVDGNRTGPRADPPAQRMDDARRFTMAESATSMGGHPMTSTATSTDGHTRAQFLRAGFRKIINYGSPRSLRPPSLAGDRPAAGSTAGADRTHRPPRRTPRRTR